MKVDPMLHCYYPELVHPVTLFLLPWISSHHVTLFLSWASSPHVTLLHLSPHCTRSLLVMGCMWAWNTLRQKLKINYWISAMFWLLYKHSSRWTVKKYRSFYFSDYALFVCATKFRHCCVTAFSNSVTEPWNFLLFARTLTKFTTFTRFALS
jgi:hypothetical protein